MEYSPIFVLNITYGYVGIWNDQLTNFSDRGSVSFERNSKFFKGTTAEWIQHNRDELVKTIKKGLIIDFNEKWRGQYDPHTTLIPLCHIISESIIETRPYFD